MEPDSAGTRNIDSLYVQSRFVLVVQSLNARNASQCDLHIIGIAILRKPATRRWMMLYPSCVIEMIEMIEMIER